MIQGQDAFSELERDALQEIMNIGFGRAVADLADIIDMHVILSIPYIDVMETTLVREYINREIPDKTDMNMITQFFSGRFSGTSFLVLPQGEGKKLLRLFEAGEEAFDLSDYDFDILERDALVEIGNIIIGACVGKIAEMLGDIVNYAPPRFFTHEAIFQNLETLLGDNSESFAILFKTVFHFEHYDVSGYLFMVSNYNVLEWMKKAIADYLSQYE